MPDEDSSTWRGQISVPPGEFKRHMLRGVGFFLISVFTGLAVYQTPPTSWGELGLWIWQPGIQGVLAALTSLGLNAATERTR